MKKFINNTKNIVDELLEGFALANPELVRVEQKRIVVNKDIENLHRVTVVAIGGSGHEPCACGFVGNGMLDVFVAGEIFTAPGVKPTLEALKIADRGHGILFVVLNHSGDMLTGKLAMEECKKLGMNVRLVVTQEDISNAPRSNASNRRGLVGCVPLFKIAGAAAAAGKSLDEVAEIAQQFADNMATLAVGVKGAVHPVTGNLLADLGEDQMEIGMGQHGEEGGGRQKMRSADDTAAIMIPALLRDLQIKDGEKIMLILDGSGATTLMELFIVYRKCVSLLKAKNIDIVANAIGELLTVQDAAGFQMCIARMDKNLLQLWNAPCKTAYFKK
jgi:dihydroxyacetone kinase-like protein